MNNNFTILCKYDEEIANTIKDKSNIILIIDQYDLINYRIEYKKFKSVFFIRSFNEIDELLTIAEIIKTRVGTTNKIISFTEYGQYGAYFLKSYFNKNKFDLNVANICRNKFLMKKFANSLNLKTTRYELLDSIFDVDLSINVLKKLKFPIVLKTLNGMGSENTFICLDIQQATKILQKIRNSTISKNLLAEEFVVGTEYHADALISNGKMISLSISKYCTSPIKWKITKLEFGECLNYFDNKKLYNKIQNQIQIIHKKMGISPSIFHYEFFIDKNGNIIFSEFATRIGGGPIPILLHEALEKNSIKLNYWNIIHDKFIAFKKIIYPSGNKYYGYVNVRPKLNGIVTSLPSRIDLKKLPLLNFKYVIQPQKVAGRWGILACFSCNHRSNIKSMASYINQFLINKIKVKKIKRGENHE